MIIDKSKNVSLAIEARQIEIDRGYDGGDIFLFSKWVSTALAFDTSKGSYYPWQEFEDWTKTADGAVCDSVWDAWTRPTE